MTYRPGRASITFLFIFAVSAAMVGASISAAAQAKKDQSTSTSKWEWTDDDWRMRVAVNGKAEFTEDYSDVRSVSEGGFVRIEEERGGETRRIEIRRDADGQVVRSYSVNGESRALDSKGREWMANILLKALRHGSIDVDPRVRQLLRQGGVTRVLQEMEQVKGDYAKRVYFTSLVKNEGLSASDRQRVLAEVGRQITSDYERAGFLKKTAPIFLNSESSAAYFQNVDTIRSDYERRGVLSSLLKQKDLSEKLLGLVLDSASRLGSDYEKATLLIQASNLYTGDTLLRSAFLRAIETIKSDHERGRVLSALLKNKQII